MPEAAPASAGFTSASGGGRVFALPALVLLCGFGLAVAGACFDYAFPYPNAEPGIEIQHSHYYFSLGFLALLLLGDREGAVWRRLGLAVGGVAVAAALARFFMGFELSGRGGLNADKMLRVLFHSAAPWLWGVALWQGAPLLMGGGPRRYSGWLRLSAWALVVYGTFCLTSAAVSQDPQMSLRLFYRERAATFALLFAWLRAVQGDPALRAATGRWAVWALVGLVLLGALVGLGDMTGGRALRSELVERGFIYQETLPQTDRTIPERRLVFPMLHFNRTAYLALMAVMALLAARFAATRRREGLERWCLLGLVPSFLVMILSYTRGVTAAAVAALCLWAALVSRRALLLIAAVCLVVAVALPAQRREHFLTIFKPSTYRLDEGDMTSMKLRLLGWKYGLDVTRRMPLTGVGYGTRIVFADYERYIKSTNNPRLMNDVRQNAQHRHMHNLWLEIAVESGLPALLAFMAFTGVRWLMLGRAYLRHPGPRRPRLAAWIAFECSLLIAGTIYYMLKQNFGMLNFFVWGFMISELDELV